jgi:hypothetical protein
LSDVVPVERGAGVAVSAATLADVQRYRYGWLVAWGGCANAAYPGLVDGWSGLAGTPGTLLALSMMVLSVVIGLAAAAVRPWSWRVILGCQAVGVLASVAWARLIAATPTDVALGVGAAVLVSMAHFVYFYRRRAMFGAPWRWHALESLWPGLAGPETLGGEAVHGFTGLSSTQRRLFATSVVLGVLLQLAGR